MMPAAAADSTHSASPMWPSHDEVEMGAQAGPHSSTLSSAMDMPALRQSTRAKKPSQKAEESNVGASSSSQQDRQQGTKDDNESKDAVFCLCRKGDDGKPMVYCAECKDWFHFKCVGLTKKSASDLSVFVCPPCSERTGKTMQTASMSKEASQQVGQSSAAEKVVATPAQPADTPSNLPSPKRKRSEDDAVAKRAKAALAREKMQKKVPSIRTQPSTTTARKVSSPSQSPVAAQSSRKASMSGGSSASASSSVLKTRNDALRRHATEQFTNVFREMFLETQTEADDDAGDRAKTYADRFETALFEANHETSSGRPGVGVKMAGKEYRDKLRSFLFNLKDKSNKTLRARIASQEIDAARLATMTSEELANDEIRKEVERRKRENLEQSILKRDNKVPLRKVTHKGEVDIEVDAPPTLQHREHDFYAREAERMQAAAEEKKAETKSIQKAAATSESPVRPARSPTSDKETPVPRPRHDSTSASFDFDNVWSGEPQEKDADVEAEAENISDAADAETGEGRGEDTGLIDDARDPAADNFIDNFLGMEDNAEAATATDTTNKPSMPTEVKWRGSINMPDEGAFTGSVRQIAGRLLDESEWHALLHTPNALIEGRLPSDVAIPYLLQSQMAIRTELVALSMEPSWEPDTVPAALSSSLDSHKSCEKAFNGLVTYFHGRRRYGVVQCNPAARGKLVKDFYIAALPAQEPVPEWLAKMDGAPYLAREKDVFVLVAVLFRPMPSNNPLDPSSSLSPADRDASSKATAPALSANIASALAPGSSTLQDLLKAVGGGSGRSPAQGTPSSYTPPQHNSSSQASTSTSGMGNTAAPTGMPSASQMQALSELPKPQLEDMLTKNPNLVDNLLKALGNGRSNSPASQAGPPPPGPPPGPPPARPMGAAPYPAGPMTGQQNYPAQGNYGPPPGAYGQGQGYGAYPAQGSQAYYSQQQPFPPQQGQPGHYGQRPPPSGQYQNNNGSGFRGRGRGRY